MWPQTIVSTLACWGFALWLLLHVYRGLRSGVIRYAGGHYRRKRDPLRFWVTIVAQCGFAIGAILVWWRLFFAA